MRKFFLFLLSLSSTSFATPYSLKTYREGSLGGQISVNHFRTRSNYDTSGQQQTLVNSGEFVASDINLAGRYIMSNQWGLSGQLNLAATESNDGNNIRSNSSFTSIQLGSDHRILRGWIDLIADFDFKLPFYRVKPGTDDSLLSEGDSHLQALIEIQKRERKYTAYFYTGYRYRDEGRSAQIPYAFGGFYNFRSWSLGLELRGFTKAGDDKFTADPTQRTSITNSVDAGSLHFYSVNPTRSELEFNGRFELNRDWDLIAGLGSTIGGVSTSSGINGFVAFQFSEQPVYAPRAPKKEFIEDTRDGVDQRLFEEEDLTKELN